MEKYQNGKKLELLKAKKLMQKRFDMTFLKLFNNAFKAIKLYYSHLYKIIINLKR